MAEAVKLYNGGVYLVDGNKIVPEGSAPEVAGTAGEWPAPDVARKGTIAYGILAEHNTSGDMGRLRLRFDALASHDITYVGVIQTAKASGMTEFPVPYVLTNCHNTLCAVGGTINEDDHVFGLSAAKKYGGIFVPPHIAVIHQYMREMHAGCGKMILGTDSHTRYGALGTMAIGEGGASWSSSSSATPTTSRARASWPCTSMGRRVPAWARRTSPSRSSARSSRAATSRTPSWSSWDPACRACPPTTATAWTS